MIDAKGNTIVSQMSTEKSITFFKKSNKQTNKQKYCITFSMSQSPKKISLLGDREHHYQNLKLETLYHKALP